MSAVQENQILSILIVDDDADFVEVFKLGLKEHSFDVFGFTDPLQALEHFSKHLNQFLIVISDIRMPKMNGFEFVKMVKELKPEVKVFLMTAFEIKEAEFKSVLPSLKIDELRETV